MRQLSHLRRKLNFFKEQYFDFSETFFKESKTLQIKNSVGLFGEGIQEWAK